MVKKQIRDFLENFILVAILLVIVQTFLFEFAIYRAWSVGVRNGFVVSGLVFDIIFSVEFMARSMGAAGGRGVTRYWFYERGWVDFLSSWPLLVLDSGPSVYLLFFGTLHESASAMGALGVLKVVKAIRVTRILRLVRIIKIFGRIHNAESAMAQHHTASIATTAVFAIVVALMGFSFATAGDMEKRIRERQQHYYGILSVMKGSGGDAGEAGISFLTMDPLVLRIERGGDVVYQRLSGNRVPAYGVDDFTRISQGGLSLMVSTMDIHADLALNHMESFFLIVTVVLAIMLVYTRHFVQTISDPLHIMNTGFRKKDYDLQVAIRDMYSDDEVFRLARFYNDAFLPAKFRKIHAEDHRTKTGGLSLADFDNFRGTKN